MQIIWSKKAVIALLMTNIASASYIVEDTLTRHLHIHLKQARIARTANAASGNVRRRGVVQPVYFKNSDEIQNCYNELLAKSPPRDEGSVLVNLTVKKDGAVDRLNLVKTDFDDPSFNDCLLSKIKATRLPASEDRAGVLIAHRFNFHRKTVTHLNFAE